MGRSGGGGPAILLVAAVLVAGAAVSNAQLKVGFYSKSCPTAESTVASAVRQFADADSTILPALVRLQFHDCFVKGCDGSVLIKGVGNNAEVNNNKHQGLRGLDVVDSIKQQLESECPGVVSCADIVVLASRDAIAFVHGRAVVRRADGAARRADVEPPRRRRAPRRQGLHRRPPLQVRRQWPRRQGPRPPQLGAHGGDDGVLLPAGQAVQLPARRRRPRRGPVDPGGVPVGAPVAVRARRLQHAAAARPRQRGRVRHLHPPQHPQRLRRHRLRRRALQRHGHRRRRRHLLQHAQRLLRPLLPAGLRRRHGQDGERRRAHRRRRRGQEGLLQVQLSLKKS
uniref:Peroxidase n=1 Tax=Oryza glaberrima TaxID=4538 RepID=I1QYJ4_ORYGL